MTGGVGEVGRCTFAKIVLAPCTSCDPSDMSDMSDIDGLKPLEKPIYTMSQHHEV